MWLTHLLYAGSLVVRALSRLICKDYKQQILHYHWEIEAVVRAHPCVPIQRLFKKCI